MIILAREGGICLDMDTPAKEIGTVKSGKPVHFIILGGIHLKVIFLDCWKLEGGSW
jgi:hypothetical protein